MEWLDKSKCNYLIKVPTSAIRRRTDHKNVFLFLRLVYCTQKGKIGVMSIMCYFVLPRTWSSEFYCFQISTQIPRKNCECSEQHPYRSKIICYTISSRTKNPNRIMAYLAQLRQIAKRLSLPTFLWQLGFLISHVLSMYSIHIEESINFQAY